jgi:hypothetical protein
MGTVVSILQQYTAAAANGARPEPALARRMDGALLAIGVMSDILKAKVGLWGFRSALSGFIHQLEGRATCSVAACLKLSPSQTRN